MASSDGRKNVIARRVRSGLRLSLLCGCCAALAGCNYLILIGYLIGGPPSIEPDFDALTNKSMTEKDITVAVVCYAPSKTKFDFDAIDRELQKYVTYRLNEHHIKVVSPDHIRKWLDENKDWDKPEEIGEAFDVDYVIYIDLGKFTLFEEHSSTLFRGRSEALVKVYEMDEADEGEMIFSKEITSTFPTQAPRSTSEVSYQMFKRQYLSFLSDEIGHLFYEYYLADEMDYAT